MCIQRFLCCPVFGILCCPVLNIHCVVMYPMFSVLSVFSVLCFVMYSIFSVLSCVQYFLCCPVFSISCVVLYSMLSESKCIQRFHNVMVDTVPNKIESSFIVNIFYLLICLLLFSIHLHLFVLFCVFSKVSDVCSLPMAIFPFYF